MSGAPDMMSTLSFRFVLTVSFTFVNLRAESFVFVIVDGVQHPAVLEPVHCRLVGIGHQQLAVQGAQVQSLIASGQTLNIRDRKLVI